MQNKTFTQLVAKAEEIRGTPMLSEAEAIRLWVELNGELRRIGRQYRLKAGQSALAAVNIIFNA